MAASVTPFLLFRGPDGEAILQKAEDISTVITERRGSTPRRAAYSACYLLLANRNRVEVVDETVTTVFDKLEAANGPRPLIFDAGGPVAESDVLPTPEKEPTDA